MPAIPNPHAESVRDAVTSYHQHIDVPALDAGAVAARRRALRTIAPTAHRALLRTAVLATAAALAVFVAVDASAVVAGMQRVVAAFALARGRAVPLDVREVDLATARAGVPFEIIVPPALAGTTMTLREVVSASAPADDSVIFDVNFRRPASAVSIVETGDAAGPREMYLSAREPDRDDAKVAPLRPLPKLAGSAGPRVSVVGNFGQGSFVPLTWVTRGTRIVLMSPPGALSRAQIRTLQADMSH